MAKEKKQQGQQARSESQAIVSTAEAVTPRMQTKYREQVIPNLVKQFGYANVMQAPRLLKIAVNRGVGDATGDAKLLTNAIDELQVITGQKAMTTKAKKAISNFKLRENMPIGARVTLRGAKMYEFLDRFISVAVPRIRDFRGLPDRSFDGHGNYTLGVKEQIIFPEIDVDRVGKIDGMDITFVTSAGTDEEAYALLKELGFPFRKRETVETGNA
ncbi:MAG: ribosomal protein [Chlorobi bacterium]|nr:ribosomal protein [Chlorobiota bacterium]